MEICKEIKQKHWVDHNAQNERTLHIRLKNKFVKLYSLINKLDVPCWKCFGSFRNSPLCLAKPPNDGRDRF